jgi:hypothetical protein
LSPRSFKRENKITIKYMKKKYRVKIENGEENTNKKKEMN